MPKCRSRGHANVRDPQFHYISHLHVAVGGLIVGLGAATVALALPLHYVYGLATVGHPGPIYLTVAILLAGTVLAHTSLKRGA